MSNSKAAAAYHPDQPPPVVAVHAVTLYEAACHSCGWSSGLLRSVHAADLEAEDHSCQGD